MKTFRLEIWEFNVKCFLAMKKKKKKNHGNKAFSIGSFLRF